jgi:hypothetical protein
MLYPVINPMGHILGIRLCALGSTEQARVLCSFRQGFCAGPNYYVLNNNLMYYLSILNTYVCVPLGAQIRQGFCAPGQFQICISKRVSNQANQFISIGVRGRRNPSLSLSHLPTPPPPFLSSSSLPPRTLPHSTGSLPPSLPPSLLPSPSLLVVV